MVRRFSSKFCWGQGKIPQEYSCISRNFDAVIGKICRKDACQFLWEQVLITAML